MQGDPPRIKGPAHLGKMACLGFDTLKKPVGRWPLALVFNLYLRQIYGKSDAVSGVR